MTLLNFTDPIPFPPPVTSGSTTQSYTDPLGDWWVAKNGVNGGSWYRARDVLYARMNRVAAYTGVASGAMVPYDTISADPYGCCTAGASAMFTCPVPGRYFVAGRMSETITVNTRLFTTVMRNGAGIARGIDITTASAPASSYVACAYLFAAGDQIQIQYYSTAAVALEVGPNGISYMDVNYLGTG
jgi:hypothetical protein